MQSDRFKKSSHVKLGLLANNGSNITLTLFIAKLNKALQKQTLQIVNSPACLMDRSELSKAQDEIQMQTQKMESHGLLCGTTEGLAHLLPKKDSEELRHLHTEEVREYYNQLAILTLDRKKCTCDGLCAATFQLAKTILEEHSIKNVTVEICQLSNWSHTLIRLSQINDNGDTEIFFYDPWYQACYTDKTSEPKIFPEENLAVEMKSLIHQTNMIIATDAFTDMSNFTRVKNTNRDFSYFVACSTGEFTNPTATKPDPTPCKQHICLVS